MPKQIIHSDFHPHNINMSDNHKAIIDFENARQPAAKKFLCYFKFGRNFYRPKSKRIFSRSAELKNLFIENYCKIKPLSEEIVLLPILRILLSGNFVCLKGVYHEGNNIWINDLPKHIVAIDEINYFGLKYG